MLLILQKNKNLVIAIFRFSKLLNEKKIFFSEVVNLTLKRLCGLIIRLFYLGWVLMIRKAYLVQQKSQEILKERVFDMPASENAMTGVAIGMSLNKMIP